VKRPNQTRGSLPAPAVDALEPRRLLATNLPVMETDPMPHTGDAADDPAVWVHPTDPSLSTIIGTDKRGGLAVYGLDGRQLAYHADGNMNNVDLRYNFPLGGAAVDLVVATNRSNNSLAVYKVDPQTRLLAPVAARVIPSDLTIYGICLYRSPVSGKYYAFVSDRDSGGTEQWELFDDGNGRVDGRVVRTFDVGGTHEGMVADDPYGRLYVAEEEVALWRYGAEPVDGAARVLVDVVGTSDVKLYADLEGLAIYHGANGSGYLLASSQGSNEFAAYDRVTGSYVARFKLGATPSGIDQVSGTDGIEVLSYGLGPAFPDGIFIAQDDTNGSLNQNFKAARWGDIARAERFFVDSGQDPRVPQVINRPASVVGRHVFYNNSAGDGHDSAANGADDAAIAADKRALLEGQAATPASYTTVSRGINGLMIDTWLLPAAARPTGDDFLLEIPDDAGGWTMMRSVPQVSVRRVAGASGADRITLTLPDGAVRNTWLRVTARATANTGLASPDVFYYGNLVGDTGDAPAGRTPVVNAADVLRTRRALFSTDPTTRERFDFNRDGAVTAIDLHLARRNLGSPLPPPPGQAVAPPPGIDRAVSLLRPAFGSAAPALCTLILNPSEDLLDSGQLNGLTR
jgi:3-phytase